LSWDERPYKAGLVIPLGITSNYLQDFIIRVDSFAIPAGGKLYLYDKFKELYTLLNYLTEYRFSITTDTGSQGNNRFELELEASDTQISSNNVLKTVMYPIPTTNSINITYISRNTEETSVNIFTLDGVKVLNQNLGLQQSGNINIILANLPLGIYIVEFKSGNEKILQRIVKE
jgi:hypothetical protein